MEQGGGAYGSSGATGDFDLKTFLTKPQVILRLLGTLFSIVVFGCIMDKGWISLVCIFNDNVDACRFGTAIGIIAFLGLLAFIISDALFDNLSNVMHRKYVVMADIAFAGLWTFMWFVCFCFLADTWRRTGVKEHRNNAQAAIAFAFFSIIDFGALTFFAVRKYRLGIASDFQSGYDPDIFGEGGQGGPYSGPSDAYQGGDYRQSPFAEPQSGEKSGTGGYQG